MKKILSILITFTLVVSLFSTMPATADASANNSFRLGEKNDTSCLLYVNKKYIYSNKKGIFIKSSPKGKSKKITSKTTEEAILSNGKTVYFVTYPSGTAKEPEQINYKIYSVKTNGKGLKAIKSGKGMISLVTIYKNNLYYQDSKDGNYYNNLPCRLVKLSHKSKKSKCISGSKTAGKVSYFNGKIYFSNYVFSYDEIDKDSIVYSVNLNNDKIKKEISYSASGNYSYTTSKSIYFYSFKWSGSKMSNVRIYTIDKNNKLTKSKKLPNNSLVKHITSDGKYAIINNNETYYKFNLKTGAKKKIITTSGEFDITSGVKPTSSVYFIFDDNTTNRVAVKKLVGNKLKHCKISGNVNMKISNKSYWIAGNYLLVESNGLLKSYKLKALKTYTV